MAQVTAPDIRSVQRENVFVFVVCGAAEHIHTLNFSLRLLRHFSQCRILVVTDSYRNALAIDHPHIIQVETPHHFTNHQASIYLKTGLHKWLPAGPLYCYLDTDVVALNTSADEVFKHFHPPVTFCTDHCRMRKFSPSAVSDPVVDRFRQDRERLEASIQRHRREQERKVADPTAYMEIDREVQQWNEQLARARWNGDLSSINQHTFSRLGMNMLLVFLFAKFARCGILFNKKPLLHLFYSLVYFTLLLPVHLCFLKNPEGDYCFRIGKAVVRRNWLFPAYFADRKIFYSPLDKGFYTSEKTLLFQYHEAEKSIQRETGFRWDDDKKQWSYRDGTVFYYDESDTLRQRIEEKFGVKVTEPNWQHWNGGVFLFDKSSHDFMNTWHEWTLQIFEDPNWKTRDQGTLIATAWKHHLQHHSTLPITFNFIADYFHSTMSYKGCFEFDVNRQKQGIRPSLLHLYHHWGDANWKVWADVAQLSESIIHSVKVSNDLHG